MPSEGRLIIEVSPGGVKIASTRPLHLVRAFEGMRLTDVTRTLPLIFSICGMAQGAAAAGAAEDALGTAAPPDTAAVRRLLVLAETAREHFIRVIRDWPRFAGGEPEHARLAEVMRWEHGMRKALKASGQPFAAGAVLKLDGGAARDGAGALAALLEAAVFGEPPAAWLQRSSLTDLAAWAGMRRTSAQRLIHHVLAEGQWGEGAVEPDALPDLPREALAARLFAADAAGFAARPVWDGAPRESTPLTRERRSPQVEAFATQQGCGLGARLMACLVELASIPAQLTAPPPHPAAARAPHSQGIAHVEAVRGRLTHGVELENGVVRRYVIVAPTEWNFHPSGAAMRGLAAIAAAGREDWRTIADLYISAVDPCVAYELRAG